MFLIVPCLRRCREKYCENLRKKGKDIPKECSQGKSVSFGVAGGVRQ